MGVDLWSSNGFRSEVVMNEVHVAIIEVLKGLIEKNTIVMDLGCGNGVLLSKLCKNNGVPYGIDPDSNKLEQAIQLCPTGQFFMSDIFNELIWSHYPDVVLFSAGKFSDTSVLNRKMLLEHFVKISYIVFYSYGKYAEGQSIFDLFFRIGFNFPNSLFDVKRISCTNDCEAVLLCPKLQRLPLSGRNKNSSLSF